MFVINVIHTNTWLLEGLQSSFLPQNLQYWGFTSELSYTDAVQHHDRCLKVVAAGISFPEVLHIFQRHCLRPVKLYPLPPEARWWITRICDVKRVAINIISSVWVPTAKVSCTHEDSKQCHVKNKGDIRNLWFAGFYVWNYTYQYHPYQA